MRTDEKTNEVKRLRKVIGALDFALARADEKLRIVFKDGCEYVGGVPIQFLLREIADARQVADREINGS